ncbi:MAG: GxxExxY protein [Muribaculaceae bacterium]|nr:GxxExxY protein [Muribaculaceae bacterium]
MNDNELVGIIRGGIFEVFKQLGPGLLESVYQDALMAELIARGLKPEKQVEVPILYKGKEVSAPLRIDILVNKRIIVELKAVEGGLKLVHYRQIQTYLRLSNLHRGILVNFNTSFIGSDDIETVLNSHCTRKNS